MNYKKITEQDSLYNDIEKKSINHIVLNAKNHEKEAEIIANA